MRTHPETTSPEHADRMRAIPPVVCYPVEALPPADMALYREARKTLEVVETVMVEPRQGRCFNAPAGHFFRIVSVEGPQVGDLNLWNANDLTERFYSGKTRALHATHITTGDRMWSTFPYLRPMATITHDTLDWYGVDPFGGRIHDVIGTRCDPYTHALLSHGGEHHHCCHSNLSRALGAALKRPPREIEGHVHDVLNVFMCTGFTKDTGQYFTKATPVRPGDYIEFFAEIDLIGGLSACPGGDCSTVQAGQEAACHPLKVEILRPASGALAGWKSPPPSGYSRSHGV
ncbi:MAG: urea carboxylase-associated family protein [Elsteraceae bacterium]